MNIGGREYRTVTREEMREMDRAAIEDYGIPGIVLMENAGRSVAERVAAVCRERRFRKPVLVVCGKGNNGGDGFVVARHLHNGGLSVRVIFAGRLSEVAEDSDPGVNLKILRNMKIAVNETADNLSVLREALDGCEIVVDALLGTGLRGEVREPFRSAIEAINAASKYVVAVDIPSGLDSNEGKPLGCAVRASETVTLCLPKKGFEKKGAADYTGRLIVGEIGMPRELLA